MESELKDGSNCWDGGPCGIALENGKLSCNDPEFFCFMANFAEAELSGFHDDQLADATQAIKNILAKIPADSEGRKISLIWTIKGFLLAWVDHSGKVIENPEITHKSDPIDIATALKVKM
jgi:hypothetical protein